MTNLQASAQLIPTIMATVILIAGVIDDFRSRKFHNWLFLVCTAIAFATMILIGGFSGLQTAFMGFVAGLVIYLPLALTKIVGAGDMKLLAAFGALVGWSVVLNVAVYALIWGAAFGVVTVILNRQGLTLLKNMATIATLKERKSLTLHRIPFTAAMLVGWLTQLSIQGSL